MTLHAEILEKNGKKQFAILPYEEFVAVQERLQDLEDLQALRRAKRSESRKPSISLAEAKRKLGLS
jgi:PHD/YefM family antitoxin component YafN of YafNO toxin-antitoxin module